MGLFFNRRPPTPSLPNAFGGAAGQLFIQFASPTPDGLRIQAGNECQEAIATVTHLLGLQGDVPAALLFVQAAQKDVHLMMDLPIWLILRL
jgi:hypothetical protein